MESQISERRVEGAIATPAAGTNLVIGNDLDVGVECAIVKDPVTDALESELADGGGYAHLVAQQANREERAYHRAEKAPSSWREIAGGVSILEI
jgi:hypothetical protein